MAAPRRRGVRIARVSAKRLRTPLVRRWRTNQCRQQAPAGPRPWLCAGGSAYATPSLPSARRRAAGIQMETLVGEQKQDGVALLLDPAGRRSLISPFRSSRKCQMFVGAEAAFWTYTFCVTPSVGFIVVVRAIVSAVGRMELELIVCDWRAHPERRVSALAAVTPRARYSVRPRVSDAISGTTLEASGSSAIWRATTDAAAAIAGSLITSSSAASRSPGSHRRPTPALVTCVGHAQLARRAARHEHHRDAGSERGEDGPGAGVRDDDLARAQQGGERHELARLDEALVDFRELASKLLAGGGDDYPQAARRARPDCGSQL